MCINQVDRNCNGFTVCIGYTNTRYVRCSSRTLLSRIWFWSADTQMQTMVVKKLENDVGWNVIINSENKIIRKYRGLCSGCDW